MGVNNILFTGMNPACDHQGKTVLALHPSLKVHLSVPAHSVCPAEAGSPARSLGPALPCPPAGIHSTPFSTARAPKLTEALAEERGEHPPNTLSCREENSPSTLKHFPNVFISICCCHLYLRGSGQGDSPSAPIPQSLRFKRCTNC